MGSQQTGTPPRRLLLAGVCAAAVPLVIFVAGLPSTADVSVARARHRRLTSTVVAAEDALDSIAEKQGSLEQAKHPTVAAQKALAEAKESPSSALQQANEQIAMLQVSAGMGPFGIWLRAQDGKALPAALGVVGACAVLGPAAFVRLFLAVVGSGVAGLLVASCYAFLSAGAEAPWVGAVVSVFTGSGPAYSYVIWVLFALVGVLRWWFGTEVILPGRYHPDDMPESAIDARPLLAAEKGAINGEVRSRSALPAALADIPRPPAVPKVTLTAPAKKTETPSVPVPPRPPQ